MKNNVFIMVAMCIFGFVCAGCSTITEITIDNQYIADCYVTETINFVNGPLLTDKIVEYRDPRPNNIANENFKANLNEMCRTGSKKICQILEIKRYFQNKRDTAKNQSELKLINSHEQFCFDFIDHINEQYLLAVMAKRGWNKYANIQIYDSTFEFEKLMTKLHEYKNKELIDIKAHKFVCEYNNKQYKQYKTIMLVFKK